MMALSPKPSISRLLVKCMPKYGITTEEVEEMFLDFCENEKEHN